MTNSRRRSLRTISTLGVGTLVLASCADDKPLNTFEPRGPKAEIALDLMYPYIWAIMGFVFVAVVFGGISLTVKNRVKPEDFDHDDLPYQRHGNDKLEIGWTILPAIVLAIVSVPTVISIWKLEEKNDSNQLDVMVIGQQWWWEYRYDVDGDGFFRDADGDGEIWGADGEGGDADDREWPLELALDPDDLVVANELVIPVGMQVDLTITSRDVIHSYWIPRLNGKRDAVPGRFTTWSLEADEVGKYTGWCTEYCGLSHARMRMSTVALEQGDWDQWFANQLKPAEVPTDEAALAGRTLFQANCASCHVIRENDLDVFGEDESDPYLNPYNLSQEEYEAVFSEDQRATLGDDPNAVAFADLIPLTSMAAPDLTHVATRSVFAGAIYSQYAEVDADDDNLLEQYPNYLTLSEDARWNVPQLTRWIRNAPEQKAMYADGQRGMPAFPGLSATDIDNLVAYLATLD
ncbi:MAG: cytochrome c oxidase subunit II [Acidimicrobiales bacterium]